MSEHVGDDREPMTAREQAEVWLQHADHAQTLQGEAAFTLRAIAHLLRSIDDKLTPQTPLEPETMHIERFGEIRIFHSTDEVIDFLLNDHESTE